MAQFLVVRPKGAVSWNRVLSSLVAIAYVVLALIFRGGEAAIKVGFFVLLPLTCIWFSDAMGRYTGFFGAGGYPITQQSPGILVRVMGWVVLLLPVVFVAIAFFSV